MTSHCNVTGSYKTKSVATALGIFGAVVMPHNIYLHSALVLSRNIDRDSEKAVKEGILYNAIDSGKLSLRLIFFSCNHGWAYLTLSLRSFSLNRCFRNKFIRFVHLCWETLYRYLRNLC
eukprot:m.208524 g.208524  ORF g.208524 m.208524 type:complete len:119 (+) comp39709_c0_seq43:1283-1639(+)